METKLVQGCQLYTAMCQASLGHGIILDKINDRHRIPVTCVIFTILQFSYWKISYRCDLRYSRVFNLIYIWQIYRSKIGFVSATDHVNCKYNTYICSLKSECVQSCLNVLCHLDNCSSRKGTEYLMGARKKPVWKKGPVKSFDVKEFI